MTRLLGSSRLFGLLAAILCLAFLPSQAAASHYRLGATGLLSKAEVGAFKKAGVTSTKALLEAGLDRRARGRLSRKTSLKRKRVDALVLQCDLLRIPGVGPTVVRLFQEAGYQGTRALQRAQAGVVWQKIAKSNARLRLVPEAPAKELVANWVRAAKSLPRVVKGLK